MQICDVIIFFELRTIQQKTVKPTYLCPLGAKELAEGLHRKFARFVLFRLIKKRSFNLLCVLDFFSERWQTTLFQIFFFYLCDVSKCLPLPPDMTMLGLLPIDMLTSFHLTFILVTPPFPPGK